jgi:uncharacterized protein
MGRDTISIGVMSDSHGNVALVRQILRREALLTYWVHCGDGCRDLDHAWVAETGGITVDASPKHTLVAVSGNCDSPVWAPRESVFEALGTRFLVFHGDRLRVQLDLQGAVDEAHRHDAQVVLYGHTHRADYRVDEGVHLFNPGSLQRGQDGASYGRITVAPGKALRFEIERVS